MSRRRQSSLADEIAELMDTRPAEAGAEEDEQLGDEDESRELLAPEDRPVAMGARRVRGATLDLGALGSKYAGHVTTRADMQKRDRLRRKPAAGEEEEGEEEEDSEEEEESEEGEEESEAEGEEEEEEESEEEGEEEEESEGEAGAEGLYAQWNEAQAQ